MDQGVLENFKKRYSSKLLHIVLANDDELIENLKKVDMLDIVCWSASAWDELPEIFIVWSWRKPDEWWNQDSEQISIEESEHKEMSNENLELLSFMQKIPGCDNANQQDLVEWLATGDDFECDDNDIFELVRGKNDGEDEIDDE